MPQGVVVNLASVGTGLGALGWVVGIVSGWLQFLSWRENRRLGPAKEHLFAEALRDFKGKYTEEQIAELTAIHADLDRRVKNEIPLQARREFLRSQRSAIANSMSDLYQQYQAVDTELQTLTSEEQAPADPIRLAIADQITSPVVRRERRRRRLLVVAFSLALLTQVSSAWEYITQILYQITPHTVFGRDNLLSYVVAALVVIALAYYPDWKSLRALSLRKPLAVAGWGLAALLCWTWLILMIWPTNIKYADYQDFLAAVSLIPLAIFVRLNGTLIATRLLTSSRARGRQARRAVRSRSGQ